MNPANVVSLIRICMIPVMVTVMAVAVPASEWYSLQRIVAFVLFVTASATDWLDGYIARSRGLITDLGKFLDPLADKLLVSAALIMLVQWQDAVAWMVWVILAREFAVTGLRAVIAAKGQVMAADWSGKVKTVVQMVVIGLLLLGITGGGWLLLTAMLVTVASGVEYFWKNKGFFEQR
ncbi:MAG: CDP-diacylglycerol--glycerol-3-phosphate 3-phosphatidyltransferase [Peptococcaceae bacterium]|nr:CDP-diacylglycerol--glycerol-3-phosphate 3-phosphatidyltransferase [Peptococcaceae bacterium]